MKVRLAFGLIMLYAACAHDLECRTRPLVGPLNQPRC